MLDGALLTTVNICISLNATDQPFETEKSLKNTDPEK